MQRLSRLMLSILSVSSMVFGLTCMSARATDAATPLPDIELIKVENATVTYEVKDYDGRLVKVVEPAQSITAVRTNNKDGIVRGTLASVDPRTRYVKVQTEAGQTLVLSLSPNMFQTVEVGTPIEFVLPERAAALTRP